KIKRLKYLVKRTYRLYACSSECFTVFCKQSETTFVLIVQIYFFIRLLFAVKGILADLTEVFLKASTAFSSLLICLLRATFILLPKCFLLYVTMVLYFACILNSPSIQICSSTSPRTPLLGSFCFFSTAACSSLLKTDGLNPFLLLLCTNF